MGIFLILSTHLEGWQLLAEVPERSLWRHRHDDLLALRNAADPRHVQRHPDLLDVNSRQKILGRWLWLRLAGLQDLEELDQDEFGRSRS